MAKYRHRRTKKRGGFWPFTSSSSPSTMLSSQGSGISDYVNPIKEKISKIFSSSSTASGTTGTSLFSSNETPPPPLSQGGRKSKRRMRGGVKPFSSLNNLASSAARYAGVTAKAHKYVGGKSRRRHHRCKKNCKH